VISREKPNSWPEPVSFWKFSLNLDSSIFERERLDGSELCTHDRINVVDSIGCSCASIESIGCALISRS